MSSLKWDIREIIYVLSNRMLINSIHNFHPKNININSLLSIPKNLFIAIKGKKYNGIYFLDEAINNGAEGIILEEIDLKKINLRKIKKKKFFV